MKRRIIIAIFLCLTFIGKAQERLMVVDSTYSYFIAAKSPDLTKLKLVDSLINIESKKSYIKVHLHGDNEIKEDYQIYYLKDGWKFSSNYKTKLRRTNDIDISNGTENPLYRHIVYTNRKMSSGYEEYLYLIIINRKIVSSLISSDMLVDIDDRSILDSLKIYSMFY